MIFSNSNLFNSYATEAKKLNHVYSISLYQFICKFSTDLMVMATMEHQELSDYPFHVLHLQETEWTIKEQNEISKAFLYTIIKNQAEFDERFDWI